MFLEASPLSAASVRKAGVRTRRSGWNLLRKGKKGTIESCACSCAAKPSAVSAAACDASSSPRLGGRVYRLQRKTRARRGDEEAGLPLLDHVAACKARDRRADAVEDEARAESGARERQRELPTWRVFS